MNRKNKGCFPAWDVSKQAVWLGLRNRKMRSVIPAQAVQRTHPAPSPPIQGWGRPAPVTQLEATGYPSPSSEGLDLSSSPVTILEVRNVPIGAYSPSTWGRSASVGQGGRGRGAGSLDVGDSPKPGSIKHVHEPAALSLLPVRHQPLPRPLASESRC